MEKRTVYRFFLCVFLFFLMGCHTAQKSQISQETLTTLIQEKDSEIQTLQAKLAELEKEKALKPPPQSPAATPSSFSTLENPIRQKIDKKDVKKGFTQDPKVQAYQQGKILFDSQKYPESILAFSAFIESYPSHPLVSNAQFFLAEAYFQQNDIESAEIEFLKIIKNHPQSPFISHAYAREAVCLSKLGQTALANQQRERLIQLFPHSPALDWVPTPFVSNAAPSVQANATHEPSRAEPPARYESSASSDLDGVPLTAPETGETD